MRMPTPKDVILDALIREIRDRKSVAKAEHDECEKLREQLKIATEVLEFYADQNNWHGHEPINLGEIFDSKILDRGRYEPARKALVQIRDHANCGESVCIHLNNDPMTCLKCRET